MAGDGPGGWQETNLIPAKESGLHPADGAVGAIEGHDAEGRADSDLASWGCHHHFVVVTGWMHWRERQGARVGSDCCNNPSKT